MWAGLPRRRKLAEIIVSLIKALIRKRHRPGWGWRASNVDRADPEAEISRNNRFLSKSFNEKATQARMGLDSLKCGPGCPGGGNEPQSSFL